MTRRGRGTTRNLYDQLADAGSHSSQRQFSKFCGSPRVLINQLMALEKDFPGRVQHSDRAELTPRKKSGAFYWRITTKNTGEEDCF